MLSKDLSKTRSKNKWDILKRRFFGTLESYLESVKVQLAEIKTMKPEYNLSRNEFRAIAELKHNSALNLKRQIKAQQQSS